MKGAIGPRERRIGEFDAFARDDYWRVSRPCERDGAGPTAMYAQSQGGGLNGQVTP